MTTRPAGGLSVVDEAIPVEEAEIERLPRRIVNVPPVAAHILAVVRVHRRRGARTQAAQYETDRQRRSKPIRDRCDHRRKAQRREHMGSAKSTR